MQRGQITSRGRSLQRASDASKASVALSTILHHSKSRVALIAPVAFLIAPSSNRSFVQKPYVHTPYVHKPYDLCSQALCSQCYSNPMHAGHASQSWLNPCSPMVFAMGGTAAGEYVHHYCGRRLCHIRLDRNDTHHARNRREWRARDQHDCGRRRVSHGNDARWRHVMTWVSQEPKRSISAAVVLVDE